MEITKYVIYITPVGFMCTCGMTKRTPSAIKARRFADIHKNDFHNFTNSLDDEILHEVKVVNYQLVNASALARKNPVIKAANSVTESKG